MNSAMPRAPSPRRPLVFSAALAVTVPMLVAGAASPSPAGGSSHDPVLVGRAVLPVETYAGPPESGRFVIPGAGTRNGIDFPLADSRSKASRRIIDGRDRGEILAMPDNGFGGKANSVDFLIRAYYLRPALQDRRRRVRLGRGRQLHLVPRPVPHDRLPDRQGGHGRPAAHRRGHRSRVAATRTTRRPLGRRRVRPVDPALRLPRPAPRSALPAAREPHVAQQPVPGPAGSRHPPEQSWVRGDGDQPGRQVPLRGPRGSPPGGCVNRAEPARSSTSSAPGDEEFTGRTLQYEVDAGNPVRLRHAGPRPAPPSRRRARRRSASRAVPEGLRGRHEAHRRPRVPGEDGGRRPGRHPRSRPGVPAGAAPG